jgi:ABC-2 type transport system ATP-binding protein
VLENIRFFAELRGLRAAEWRPRCMEILEFVGLAPFTGRRAGQLSGGMKQKLGLATALVHRPRLLLLDEPTTGVDPVTRQDFWQLIIRLVSGATGEAAPGDERVAVLISTPYMDEAVRCTRVGFIKGGRLLLEGTPAELRSRLDGRIIELRGSPILDYRRQVEKDPGVEDVQMFGDRLHLRAWPGETQAVLSRLSYSLRGEGGERPLLRSIPPQLEDVFISLLAETGSNDAPLKRSGQEV